MKPILTTHQMSELIEKIVGNIDFWAESNHDADALENVNAFGELAVDLVAHLLSQYSFSLERKEASVCALKNAYDEWLDVILGLMEQYKRTKEKEE